MLEYETLERGIRVLCGDPAAEVARRFELDPERVRILATGVLLLEKVSELLGQPLQIGKGGLREGVILDLLNGRRQRLLCRAPRRLAAHVERAVASSRVARAREVRDSTARSLSRRRRRGWSRCGRRRSSSTPRRCSTSTTSSGVHDMRVATRRLRAAMEVFEALLPAQALPQALER